MTLIVFSSPFHAKPKLFRCPSVLQPPLYLSLFLSLLSDLWIHFRSFPGRSGKQSTITIAKMAHLYNSQLVSSTSVHITSKQLTSFLGCVHTLSSKPRNSLLYLQHWPCSPSTWPRSRRQYRNCHREPRHLPP